MPDEPFRAESVRQLRAFAHAHIRRESPPALQLVLQLVRRAVRHVLATLSDVRPYASQVESRSGRSPNSAGHEGVPRFSHFVLSHLVDSNPGPMRYELAADLPDGRFVRHLAGFRADCAWLRHGDEDEFGDESAPTIACGVGLLRGETDPACQAAFAHQMLTCGFGWGDVEHVAATCTDRPERISQPTVKRDALEGPEVPTEFTARTVNV